MLKVFPQNWQSVLLVLCVLFTSTLVISMQPVYSQTTIPRFEANHSIDGLSRIIRPSGMVEKVPLSFPFGSIIHPISSAQSTNVQYQQTRPRDAETIRSDEKRKNDILSQIIVGGGAGFLAGILALRATDNPGIQVASGVSLGALSSIPFYKQSDHPTRFVLYGAGFGGVAAGLLTLFAQF